MALPKVWDPNNMSFNNITKTTPVINIPRNTSTYTSYNWSTRHRASMWSRFNNGVAEIGNWFSEKAEDVLGWISLITMAIIVISCIIKVIETWVDDGFWMAVFMAIGVCIVGVIAWYICAIAILIGVNAIMYGCRFLFWNGWTLVISIILALGIWLFVAISSRRPTVSYTPVHTEQVVTTVPTYQCTADVLNIRTSPNTYSSVIGVLRKGQAVKVYDTSNGFGRISHNGQVGYVSLDYLKKNNY